MQVKVCKWRIVGVALSVFLVNASPALMAGQCNCQLVEDWNSTPAIPDDVRGWGSHRGSALLEGGLGTGSYARAQPTLSPPNYLGVPWQGDASQWFSNEFVGDKDYRSMRVSRISSLPNAHSTGRGQDIPPRVWAVSENVMTLGGGWTSFDFLVPSQQVDLPSGWRAYPDQEQTWSQVITDVDRILIVFGRYEVDIGGAPFLWLNAVDDFKIEFCGSGMASVPTTSYSALLCLSVFTFLIGLGRLMRWSSRRLPTNRSGEPS